MEELTCTVDAQGRVMLPSWWRKQNQVRPRDQLRAFVTGTGALALETREQGIARAQALVRKYIPDDVSLVDELFQERREEAGREGNP